MAKPTLGKWRALRVNLPNHNRMDALERWRLLLTLLAVGLVIGWFLLGFLKADGGTNRFSPGPVSTNHQQFSCADCHRDFAPMNDDVAVASLAGVHSSQGGRWDRGSDSMCLACHPLAKLPGRDSNNVPGSMEMGELLEKFEHPQIEKPLPVFAHASNEKSGTVESCASCHLEHQGEDFKLTAVSDETCVKCHQELDSFCESGSSDFASTVTGFEIDHPQLRSLAVDPGTLQDFNHRLHMWPGLNPPVEGTDGRPAQAGRKDYRASDYPNSKDRLSKYTDSRTDLLQLRCELCHTPIGADTSLADTNPGASRYGAKSELMTMPDFEQACRMCHAIDILPGDPEEMEHGLAGSEIRKRAEEHLIVNYFDEESQTDDAKGRNEGKGDGKKKELSERQKEAIWQAIRKNSTEATEQLAQKRELAEAHMRIKCEKCHFWQDSLEGEQPEDMVGPVKTMTSGGVFADRWLKHGRFDHSEHSDVACARCHATAGPDGSGDVLIDEQEISAKNSDVLIAGYDTCKECHQPLQAVKALVKEKPGSRAAGYNCTYCHTYHGGGNRAYHVANPETR